MRTLDAACIEAKGACRTTSIGDADHNCRVGTGTTERLPLVVSVCPSRDDADGRQRGTGVAAGNWSASDRRRRASAGGLHGFDKRLRLGVGKGDERRAGKDSVAPCWPVSRPSWTCRNAQSSVALEIETRGGQLATHAAQLAERDVYDPGYPERRAPRRAAKDAASVLQEERRGRRVHETATWRGSPGIRLSPTDGSAPEARD